MFESIETLRPHDIIPTKTSLEQITTGDAAWGAASVLAQILALAWVAE